jgi:anti-anti-sigma factor
MPLSLDSRFCGAVYVVQCRGSIVAGAEAKLLEDFLGQRAREFTRLVLNVSEVVRLDSMGLGLIVRLAGNLRKQGGDLRLAAAPPFVVRLLDTTMLSGVLPVDATEEEAILSLLKQRPAQAAQQKRGPSVLFLDPSPDLCAFVRAVLTQHGFDVKPTCLLHDARIMLKVDKVDYILVGPGGPQQSSAIVMANLKAWSPKAVTLQLEAGFKSYEPEQAASGLLRMFETGSPS